jgi:hypothetical protein
MRCENCGWKNPPEVSQCEKCKAPLEPEVTKREQVDDELIAETVVDLSGLESTPTISEKAEVVSKLLNTVVEKPR